MPPLNRLFVAAVLSALACSSGSEPLYIGAAGPWNEAFGRMNQQGIALALEEINARGGIAGRPLRLIERDDAGDGSRAAAIASEFVANRSVLGVVGHITSGAMMAAARIYDQGLPAVATTASSPDLSGISQWTFRVIASDSANGLTMARFATARGFRRAAVLFENNSYGRGLAEAFRRGYAGEVVGFDPIPSDGKASVEPHISWLRTRAPDLVFVAGTDVSGRAVLREARRQGVAVAFMGGDGWTPVAADTALAEGAFVGAPFSARDPGDAAQRFVRAYVTRYREEPDGNAALAYDATMVLARAIEHGGASRARIREWLASLAGNQPHAGVTGPISFHPSGDVIGRGVVMTRIRNGSLTIETGAGS
ncbi:MAG TPA: branched-chain amino acid ABC transporter substrate-binding protein [Gemmatimonadaceae bacterium]